MPWLKKAPKPPRSRCRDERKKIAARLYNKAAWRHLRASTMDRMPYCVACLCRVSGGRLTPAEEVHHLTPILSGMDEAQRADLAYAPDNVAPLCRRCHRLIHEQGLRGIDEARLWRLLDALHNGATTEEIGRIISEILGNGTTNF